MNTHLETVFTLFSLHAKVQKTIDRCLSIHGITFSEFTVLHRLSKAPGQTMRRIDLAEEAGMSASGITRMLNPMEKLGLIEKETNPRDARVSLVKLSQSGQRLFDDALATATEAAQSLLAPLDAGEMERFIATARTLQNA